MKIETLRSRHELGICVRCNRPHGNKNFRTGGFRWRCLECAVMHRMDAREHVKRSRGDVLCECGEAITRARAVACDTCQRITQQASQPAPVRRVTPVRAPVRSVFCRFDPVAARYSWAFTSVCR